MSRIRTIKPEFFTHEDLFEAEHQTSLPLRLAFAGLWTQCDREGRFAWRPRQLKVAVMPYDEVDFSRVLDALLTRGFVVKYTSGNRDFGFIPSWHRHQVINNRERASDLPPPPENIEQFDASITREPRVDDACSGEGKGKEGKESLSENSDETPKSKNRFSYPEEFEAFWKAYPTHKGMGKKEAFDAWKKLDIEERSACLNAVPGYKSLLKQKPNLEVQHACRFISKRRFESFAPAPPQALQMVGEETWIKRLRYGRREAKWMTAQWGPAPGQPGCKVPDNLLEPQDGAGWREWEQAA
ncbi:hypothetical protein [Rhizobium sp. SG741]|uniref:hypothetical protein n=1 Tax=Rhizobium sp. SG741 TaxID=2587114 RepID=UPI001448396B|nr:hypothetical protein [Rhizobium sp. SG741]NKJ03457.1 hypothetical protein [Rhizobium sp. SG741]